MKLVYSFFAMIDVCFSGYFIATNQPVDACYSVLLAIFFQQEARQ
jgi:hypothetical protein